MRPLPHSALKEESSQLDFKTKKSQQGQGNGHSSPHENLVRKIAAKEFAKEFFEESSQLDSETKKIQQENGHSSPHENLVREIAAKEFKILDKGFVRLVDVMGTDGAVVQAARVSYGKGTKSLRQDRDLIRYLMRHRHNSPFEMCELKLHLKMPIFVARQWVRHRTASLNEYSARYSVMEEEFFVPKDLPLFKIQELARQSSGNRQGREEDGLSESSWKEIRGRMHRHSQRVFKSYKQWLERGLSREIARIALPLSTYTQFYWKANLHNLLHFLSLRMDSRAQREIRVYAKSIFDSIVSPLFPLTSEAFRDYRLHGVYLSRAEAEVVRQALSGRAVARPDKSSMSSREWQEFVRVFSLGSEGDKGSSESL